jgi:hypothetical protein
MSLGSIEIGKLSVNRFIIGGNPFSGFIHQEPEKDLEAKKYYTVAKIKETLCDAEKWGVNTFIGRTDNHIIRMLLEYWDEGGTIQWIAQTATGLESIERGVNNAIKGDAKACFIHGGQIDNLFAKNKMEEAISAIKKIKDAGMPAGIAGHNPEVFKWAEKNNLDVDFYMVSYYFPSDRKKKAGYSTGQNDLYISEDRDLKVQIIKTLSKPAIHYKIMAAGRNNPEEAFRFAAKHLRPQDAVCVGIYTKDHPGMIEENLELFKQSLKKSY